MGSRYKRGSTWWIKYYRNGKAMRETTGSEKESDARELLKHREGDIARGLPISPRMGRVKIDELAKDVVTNYLINHKRSLAEVERRFNKHVLPFFGGRRASAITSSDVERFILLRQGAEASNAEINRELAALKRAPSLGIRAGKLMTKPYIPMLQENNIRTGFFEREQFENVRSRLDEDLQPMVTFAYITGWRIPSEVLRLQWRLVDFLADSVRLDPGTTKNDEGRLFPFTIELREVLEQQRAKTEALQQERRIVCPWVFHRRGRPIRSFRTAWANACEEAGLPGRIPHDFRRTAVRNLVRAGVPERVAMQMTGHKTRSVFESYNIVSQADLVEAARRLDQAAGTIHSEQQSHLNVVPRN